MSSAGPRIVLASGSDARKRALEILGLDYEIDVPGIDERAIRDPDPLVLTRRLSEAKARAVAERRGDDAVIVAGDAVVQLGDRTLEKPADRDEAFAMLSALSGSRFTFATGLAVLKTSNGALRSTATSSRLTFRPLEETEIRAYMASYPVTRFAGAYESDAVERFAIHVEGAPTHRTALPVAQLVLFLRELGVPV